MLKISTMAAGPAGDSVGLRPPINLAQLALARDKSGPDHAIGLSGVSLGEDKPGAVRQLRQLSIKRPERAAAEQRRPHHFVPPASAALPT